MRILFVNALDKRYGSTYRARAIVRALRELGHTVISVESNIDQPQPDTIGIVQPDSLWGYAVASVRRALIAISRPYDLCFVQKCTPLTAVAVMCGAMRGKPVIIDWDDWDQAFQKNAVRRLMVKATEFFLPRFAAGITTHSCVIAAQAKKVSRAPQYILPQIVDLMVFDPACYDRQEIRDSLGVQGNLVLGYAGTLTEGGIRDIDVLIEFVACCAKANDRIFFLIAGGGPLQALVEARIRKAGISRFLITGMIDQSQVARYIAAMDFSLIAMRDDIGNRCRVSLKLLEYLAMERPVVGTVVGETEERLGRFVHPARTPQEFVAALNTATERPADPQARRQLINEYSFESMKAVLKEMLAHEISPSDSDISHH